MARCPKMPGQIYFNPDLASHSWLMSFNYKELKAENFGARWNTPKHRTKKPWGTVNCVGTVCNVKAKAELNFVSDQTRPRLCRCLFTATTTCLELLWLTSVWLSSTQSQGEPSGDSSRVTKTKSQTSASGTAQAFLDGNLLLNLTPA